jgi:nanoRNase/pAp phosphatase (c-di-AMP/oligoRNAs hydrolase)
VDRYFEQDILFRAMLRARSYTMRNVVVTDLRDVDPIYSGNRFMVYALHPEQNTSIWIVNGKGNRNCVFACGHSILNRTARTDIGALMRRYGGGGHHAAGTCQVEHEDAARTLNELLAAMHTNEQMPLAA